VAGLGPGGRVRALVARDWVAAAAGSRFLLVQSETSAAGRNMVKITFTWFEHLKALLAAPR
jgi:hypothetical protein